MTREDPATIVDRVIGGLVSTGLMREGIRSSGRFGAWLYEIGNMDHSARQGVEFVDNVLHGEPETVWILRGEQSEAGRGVR